MQTDELNYKSQPQDPGRPDAPAAAERGVPPQPVPAPEGPVNSHVQQRDGRAGKGWSKVAFWTTVAVLAFVVVLVAVLESTKLT